MTKRRMFNERDDNWRQATSQVELKRCKNQSSCPFFPCNCSWQVLMRFRPALTLAITCSRYVPWNDKLSGLGWRPHLLTNLDLRNYSVSPQHASFLSMYQINTKSLGIHKEIKLRTLKFIRNSCCLPAASIWLKLKCNVQCEHFSKFRTVLPRAVEGLIWEKHWALPSAFSDARFYSRNVPGIYWWENWQQEKTWENERKLQSKRSDIQWSKHLKSTS